MSVIEMEIKEHAIYKTCKEHDTEKYLAIASQSSGYAKLCCYAVKKLNENEIVSSYENICVALWRMFSKCEKFHLTGFEDMPDTDYMEKLVKLRGPPNDQGYLDGGNVGTHDKSLRHPWKLTRKGQMYAQEAENIFSGNIVTPEIRKNDDTDNRKLRLINTFNNLWKSDLYIQFDKNEIPDSIDELLVCATFDMLYSPKRFKDDFKKKLSKFESNLNAFEKDTSDNRIDKTRKFLAWIKKEAQKFD